MYGGKRRWRKEGELIMNTKGSVEGAEVECFKKCCAKDSA
jgi:hypothetical protein